MNSWFFLEKFQAPYTFELHILKRENILVISLLLLVDYICRPGMYWDIKMLLRNDVSINFIL